MTGQQAGAAPFTWARFVEWAITEGVHREHVQECFGMTLREYRKANPELRPVDARDMLADFLFGDPDADPDPDPDDLPAADAGDPF